MSLTSIAGPSWSFTTVDGRNPANHLGCIEPCKYWDKLPINWLAGFLPSTVSPFLPSCAKTHSANHVAFQYLGRLTLWTANRTVNLQVIPQWETAKLAHEPTNIHNQYTIKSCERKDGFIIPSSSHSCHSCDWKDTNCPSHPLPSNKSVANPTNAHEISQLSPLNLLLFYQLHQRIVNSLTLMSTKKRYQTLALSTRQKAYLSRYLMDDGTGWWCINNGCKGGVESWKLLRGLVKMGCQF